MRHVSAVVVHGFACAPAYTLAPVLPLTGGAALLRHPIAWLLPGGVPRSPQAAPEGDSPGIGRSAHLGSPGTRLHEHGNINPLSIDYACRPRLRSRLTLGGKTWPRNPWSSGGRVSHSAIATHACILTHTGSTAGSLRRFPARMTLPYPTPPLPAHKGARAFAWRCRGFGGALEPRYIVGAGPLDQ
jgi:hypothetical protein